MIFRNLWKLHSNPRRSLLKAIRDVGARTYLPHQAQLELYRQAYSNAVLSNMPIPGLFESLGRLTSVREMIIAEVRKVRPQNQVDSPEGRQVADLEAAVGEKFGELIAWHDEVDRQLREWLGDQVDVTAIRRGTSTHTLLDEVADVFEDGHLLSPPDEDTLQKWRELYVQRIEQDEPVGPGKSDKNKASVDEAAGDFYIWKEILRHCVTNDFNEGFIFVTDERKPDLWEFQQDNSALRRIDPRIQEQSLEETGGPMHVLTFDEFLNYAVVDSSAREILASISRDTTTVLPSWSEAAYVEFLDTLRRQGASNQLNVVIGAAREGGYVSRKQIGDLLGWGNENRMLTRFRMAADRAKRAVIAQGILDEDATDPLWAVYDGPGQAIGYAVPEAFTEFQFEMDAEDNSHHSQ